MAIFKNICNDGSLLVATNHTMSTMSNLKKMKEFELIELWLIYLKCKKTENPNIFAINHLLNALANQGNVYTCLIIFNFMGCNHIYQQMLPYIDHKYQKLCQKLQNILENTG